MTLAVFHDFPGVENGLTKFHDFPEEWPPWIIGKQQPDSDYAYRMQLSLIDWVGFNVPLNTS